jgi:hypothetical protein
MTWRKGILILLLNSVCLHIYAQQQQQDGYFYMLKETKLFSTVMLFKDDDHVQNFDVLVSTKPASVDENGNYSFVVITKDLYDNFILQFLSVDSSMRTVGSSKLFVNGQQETHADTEMPFVKTYGFSVSNEEVVVTITTELLEEKMKELTDRKPGHMIGIKTIETFTRWSN